MSPSERPGLFPSAHPNLDELRSHFDAADTAVIRRAYRQAGARYGDSEVGMWAWLLSMLRHVSH